MVVTKWSVLCLALAAMLAGPAYGGEECCGAEKGATTAKKAEGGCCGEEGAAAAAPAKKAGECDLAGCDAAHAKALDGVLAKLNAPAKTLSPEDAKAVAAAKAQLMHCPIGGTITKSFGTILEAVTALRAIDAAVGTQNGLPEDCRTKDGWCAFCAEVKGQMPEAAMKAMGVSMQSMARAEKIAQALAPAAATFLEAAKESTTKPAGMPHKVPSADELAALAKKVDEAAKALGAGFASAEKMDEALGKKLHEAMNTLDAHAPSLSPRTLIQGYKALYGDLGLAAAAMKTVAAKFPAMSDEAFVAKLPENAKNARKLLLARAGLISSLGGVHAAFEKGMGCDDAGGCEGEKPASCEPAAKPAGCCEGEKAKPAGAKPSN